LRLMNEAYKVGLSAEIQPIADEFVKKTRADLEKLQ
jgi:hypothetical protein